ncbi:MAG: quinol:cytochrome C oxidoreductase [Planctomycetota bacterium]
MSTVETIESDVTLGEAGRRPMMIAAVVGVAAVAAGLVISLLADVAPARIFRSYMVAYILVLSVSLWGLMFTMLQHATRAGWSVTVRRLCEMLASNLQWLWILFIPIAAGMFFSTRTHLFEWNIPEVVAHDEILQHKAPYLNSTFWLIRAALFFIIWAFLARYFVGNSIAQDREGHVEFTRRCERLAPVGLLLFAITSTMASIDWIMALEPHWFSTMFGVYFFAASSCSFIATVILLVFFLQRAGKLRTQITLDHYQDLGKLLFAFGIVFWAYIAYSQMMLIWYANIPEETTWFIVRTVGGWWGVSLLLIFGHFIVPFVLLISKHPKRNPAVLAALAAWMLMMAYVDFYWAIMPQVPMALLGSATDFGSFVETFMTGTMSAEAMHHVGLDPADGRTYVEVFGFRPHLMDLAWLVAMAALYAAGTIRAMRRCSLAPRQDPRLDESLAFENM